MKSLDILNGDNDKPVVMHLIAGMQIAGAEKVILNLLGNRNALRIVFI